MGQDTGGPFKGSLAISRQTPGHCVDNRGHIIPEAMLFEPPGQDQCQVSAKEDFLENFNDDNCPGVHLPPSTARPLSHCALRSPPGLPLPEGG